MPWQWEVAEVGTEYDGTVDDFEYIRDEVDITVPRQSGKTTVVRAKTVHRLVALARTLGPQRSTYTAQTRLAARKKLEMDFAAGLRGSRSFREVPHARARPTRSTEWRLSLNNGQEHIQFGQASYWQIDAPSRTGGHGDTLDDGTIDEAFAHEDDTVEGAMRPAMATRRNAQLWVISTAGDGRSKYLWRKVRAGRKATETGEHGRVAYFEWSAPDEADPSDPDVWWSCMPALGLTITEDFIRSEWERAQRKGQEGIDTFRRAYLNQWPEIPVLDDDPEANQMALEGWSECEVDHEHPRSKIDGRVAIALDVAPFQKAAAFGVAGKSGWGGKHLEVIDHRRGTTWAIDRAKQLQDRYGCKIAVAENSPAWSMKNDLEEAGVDLLPISVSEHVQACGAIERDVTEGDVHHLGQPELNVAVGAAVKRASGDAWLWSRRNSSVDICPLVAVTLARWAYDTQPDDVDIWEGVW